MVQCNIDLYQINGVRRVTIISVPLISQPIMIGLLYKLAMTKIEVFFFYIKEQKEKARK